MKTQLSQLSNSEGRKIQMDVNSVYIDYYSFLSLALNWPVFHYGTLTISLFLERLGNTIITT